MRMNLNECSNLIDELASVRDSIAELQTQERALTEALKIEMSRRKKHELLSDTFKAVLVSCTRTSLDSAKVSAAFPKEQFPSMYRSISVDSLRIVSR